MTGMTSNSEMALEVAESRRFQRVTVSLFGRYMLESKSEFPCQTTQMSPGGMVLQAPSKPGLGEQVVVYLDELGRFAGPCVRLTDAGFALMFDLPPGKRDKLADQLTWFANRDNVGIADDRRHERIVPVMRRAVLRTPDRSRDHRPDSGHFALGRGSARANCDRRSARKSSWARLPPSSCAILTAASPAPSKSSSRRARSTNRRGCEELSPFGEVASGR